MNRFINFCLLGVMIVAAIAVYDMKHRVETASINVARLESDIQMEREAIALLKAEWSHLTQPARLQQLIERYDNYFVLRDVGADQIATVSDIPLRPIDLMPNRNPSLGGFAGGSPSFVQ